MAGADGECAVELLGGDDGGELVGEGDAAKGDGVVGTGERGWRPAISRADGKDELLDASVLKRAESGGEVLGGELLAAAVGEKEGGAGAGGGVGDEVEQPGLAGEDALGAGGIACGALEIELEEFSGWAGRAGAVWRDDGEQDFHGYVKNGASVIPLFISIYPEQNLQPELIGH